jgi:tRNA-binding EMAP/Myf-like protein
MEAQLSSPRSRSLCSHNEVETLGGSTKVESPQSARASAHQPALQKIIWGNGKANLGTIGSNPPIQWPQNLKVPNVKDLIGIDASEIVEPVLKTESKLQHGQNSSADVRDGQPSKRSVKRAAKNEERKATRKAARQKEVADKRPVRESRLHEDGLPTCLSSSSDDDLIPGRPVPIHTVDRSQNKSTNCNTLRRPTKPETNKTPSILQKHHFSTQVESGKVKDLTGKTEKVPVMDPPKPAEATQPPSADDTTSTPPTQIQNQTQPQPKKEKKPKAPKQPSTPTALPLSPALIDLRVGHILRCTPHENADSLYVSTIAMGDPEGTDNTHKDEETGRIVRTVCSGLRGLIPLEEMQDRKVIVMANLKPVTMRGIKSAAMVLAASPPPKEGEDAHSADRVVELVGPPDGSEGGDKVYFEGWEYGEGKGPEKVLNPKKKQWESVQPGLFTSEELTVVFDASRLEGVEGGKGELVVEGGKGKCKVPSLKGARLS